MQRLPPEVTRLRATNRKDRPRERVVEPIDAEIRKPAWLRGRAARLWRQKLATYRSRGQSVSGCGSALAIYCRLEDEIVACWEAGTPPQASKLQAFRQLAAAFYDLPNSQVQSAKPGRKNPFLKNGHRPEE